MITELDFLKEPWNKKTRFDDLSLDEVFIHIKKRSLNAVKWGIFINVLEFLCLFFLDVFFEETDGGDVAATSWDAFFLYMDYFIFGLPVLFSVIYLFIYWFTKTSHTVKSLRRNVAIVQKLLYTFVYTNIVVFLIILYFGIYFGLSTHSAFIDADGGWGDKLTLIVCCVFISVVYMGIVCLFYKLLFYRLIETVNSNYRQLKKMED